MAAASTMEDPRDIAHEQARQRGTCDFGGLPFHPPNALKHSRECNLMTCAIIADRAARDTTLRSAVEAELAGLRDELEATKASHALQVAEVTKMAGVGADLAEAIELLGLHVLRSSFDPNCAHDDGRPCYCCRTTAWLAARHVRTSTGEKR